MVNDKKTAAKWRANFDLHVLLLMKQYGLTKSQAVVQAYHEGVEHLSKRLAPTA